MAAITRADLEQLLIELSPLPKYVGDMSVVQKDDHEARIRMEEGQKTILERLSKINGSVASSANIATQNCQQIAVMKTTLDETHTMAKDADKLSRDNAADIRWFKVIASLGGLGGISSMIAELIRAVQK
jgi:hypothetical protein